MVLLTLLTLLAELTLLILLIVLHLLDLPLEFFGLPPQHLLLEALLGSLLILPRLVGELLLPPGQFFEFLQGVIDLLLALIGAASGIAGALVLILLGIEFEIKQTFQIARSTLRPAATAAAVAKRYLDIAARGFGAQQVL